MNMMNSKTIYMVILCFCLPCCGEQKHTPDDAYELEQEGDGLLINFKDRSRPDVLCLPNSTFVNTGKFQASVEHKDGDYTGQFVALSKDEIFVRDQNGDGLPDLFKNKKTGESWSIAWEMQADQPAVKITKIAQ